MRAKINFIIVCNQAFISARTNNLNLIGIFSQITSQYFPTHHPRFSLVINFDTDSAGNHILKTKILGPNGDKVGQAELPLNILSSPVQVISTFENMVFQSPGRYEIRLSVNGKRLGSQTIDLILISNKKPALA